MTKLFKIAAISTLPLLGSCTALGGLSPSTVALVDQIQQGAIKACGFLPIVESVAAILAGPASAGVDAIVTALCATIPPTPIGVARGASRVGEPVSVVVQGKVVTGIMTR